jgi:hypothetical protein
MVIMEYLAQILLDESVPNSTKGGVDLVTKIVVVY